MQNKTKVRAQERAIIKLLKANGKLKNQKIPMEKVFYSLCYGDIMENVDSLLADGEIARLPTLYEVVQIADMISNGINWSETTDIAITEIIGRK